MRQAELHRAADLSVIVLSKDFKKTATEALFREKLREVNTEALALLPAKKILDTICVKIVELVRSSPEEIQRQLALSASQNLSSSGSISNSSDSPEQSGGVRRSSARVKKPPVAESAAQELVRSTAGVKKASSRTLSSASSPSEAKKMGAKRAFKRIKEPMTITKDADLDQSVEILAADLSSLNVASLTDEEFAAMMQQEELRAAAASAESRGEVYQPPSIVSLNAAVELLANSGDWNPKTSDGGRSLAMAQSILPEEHPKEEDQGLVSAPIESSARLVVEQAAPTPVVVAVEEITLQAVQAPEAAPHAVVHVELVLVAQQESVGATSLKTGPTSADVVSSGTVPAPASAPALTSTLAPTFAPAPASAVPVATSPV